MTSNFVKLEADISDVLMKLIYQDLIYYEPTKESVLTLNVAIND